MKHYEILFTKEAVKDIKKLTPKMRTKLQAMLENSLCLRPYLGKKLIGDLSGLYSIRLNYKDRIIYSVDEKAKIITIYKTRTHYED